MRSPAITSSGEVILETAFYRADVNNAHHGLPRHSHTGGSVGRQYEITPLLEDLFYGQRDLASHYGLESLRKAVASAPAPPEP